MSVRTVPAQMSVRALPALTSARALPTPSSVHALPTATSARALPTPTSARTLSTPTSVRALLVSAAAVVFTGFAVAPAAAAVHQVAAPTGMTSGRLGPTLTALIGLVGVIAGGLALARARRGAAGAEPAPSH
ncbi:hypothetical protein [Nocardia cyriacigeorgica]|uniref:hypothetical protein n=1 Tax=Nocardia cyriacigeorgica TaxID=135487 RepID=UPI00245664B7|nr:hypothetical protein [Nocardia cyriacigeorgica]